MTVLEHQGTPGMKGAGKPLSPQAEQGGGASEFPVRVGGNVKTDPQETASCLAMFQLYKLSLNVVSAYWE